MIRELSFIVALVAPLAAWAQGAVQQTGPVTPGHAAVWAQDHLVKDGGVPSGIPPSVITSGADPNGVTDSGPAFQQAYNVNAPTGICVHVPAGTYLINTQVTMTSWPPCFYGDGWSEAQGGLASRIGTWIHINNQSVQPFAISTTATAGSYGFFNMAFYEDQPTPAPGWTPTPYQYIFALTGTQGLQFENLYFFNVTHCLSSLPPGNSGRLHIKKWAGQPLGTCLLIDNQRDVSWIDDLHFWPFWSSDVNVYKYTQANVDPIVLQRLDSPVIGSVFDFAYHSGINFASSSNGATTGFQVGNLQVDAAKYSVWVTGNNTQGQIANFRGAGEDATTANVALTGSESYRDESTGSVVSIANFHNFYSGGSAIHILSSSDLQVGKALLWNYNQNNTGSAGITGGPSSAITIGTAPNIIGTLNGAALSSIDPTAFLIAPGIAQTWTPTLVGTTTTGSATYTSQAGAYWDDGSKISLKFAISVTGFSGFAGLLTIQGIPRPATGLVNHNGTCAIGLKSGIVLDTGYYVLAAVVPSGAGPKQIQLIESGPGNSSQQTPISVYGSSFSIAGDCTYQWN